MGAVSAATCLVSSNATRLLSTRAISAINSAMSNAPAAGAIAIRATTSDNRRDHVNSALLDIGPKIIEIEPVVGSRPAASGEPVRVALNLRLHGVAVVLRRHRLGIGEGLETDA